MTEDIKIENVYNINYILLQIAKIQEQTEYLNNAIEKLSEMGDGECGHPGSPGNIQGQAKAQAMCDIVRCRETTNQQILSIYEKMYNDVRSQEALKINLVKSAFDSNMAMINESDMDTQDKLSALGCVTDKIAELVEKIVVDE